MPKATLEERLAKGVVICAEGYLFEMERRGYVQIGPFVPEVVLNHPDAVKQLHREFLRAGSDVIEAFTYYGHRTKMRLIGKEHLLEDLNRQAIRLAKEVAAEGDALVAGNISNSTEWVDNDPAIKEKVRSMFDEQLGWARQEGVDFIIAETFDFLGEALLALECIQKAGYSSVVTLAIHKNGVLRDGCSPTEACKILKDKGATVVGLNCARGPSTMLPLLKEIRAAVPGYIAALPVPYRTCADHPTFQSLSPDDKKYTDLDPFVCTRYDMADFAKTAKELGINYIGTCCGGAPHHVRAMAEAVGRHPPASEFSPDLSKHFCFGKKEAAKTHESNLAYKDEM